MLEYKPINARNLKTDAIPTENLPLKSNKKTSSNRDSRMKVKERRALVAQMLNEELNKENVEDNGPSSCANVHDTIITTVEKESDL